MKIIIYLIVTVVVAILFIQATKKQNDAYNAQVCATYGYQSDCKTPLMSCTPAYTVKNYNGFTYCNSNEAHDITP